MVPEALKLQSPELTPPKAFKLELLDSLSSNLNSYTTASYSRTISSPLQAPASSSSLSKLAIASLRMDRSRQDISGA